jgi:7-carboxy-7-deazaguanine synthase
MDKIKVSEIFNSVQGEGFFCGTPSLFLRTFGCNFQCAGFGMPRGEKSVERFSVDPSKYSRYEDLPLIQTSCDSYPSWDVRFKDLSPMLEITAIVDRMQQLLPTGKFSRDQHLIITGGEPLLGWQKAYPALITEIYHRVLGLTDLTFETNGTQLLSEDMFNYLNDLSFKMRTTFSVSAKLPCSGETWEDAIRPDRIMQYQSLRNSFVYLKFVVATNEDVEDAHKAVKEYRDAGFTGSVYLMPVGGVDTVYNLNAKNVAELAIKYGYRYSPRLQVDLWKNSWNA